MASQVAMQAVGDLRAALSALPSGRDTAALADRDLLEVLRACAEGIKRLEGLSAWAAGTLDQRRSEQPESDELGVSNTSQLLREISGMPYRQADDMVKLGRQVVPSQGGQVTGSEIVGAALARGDLSASTAKMIADTMAHASHAAPERTAELEKQLVDLAVPGATHLGMHEDDLRKVCSGVRKELDAADPTARDRATVQKRCFNIGQEKDGLVAVRGLLLPEVAATLEATLNTLTSPRTTVLAARTATQKRHDAFSQVISAAATSKGSPVTVMIQTTQENLEQRRPGTLHTNNGPVKVSASAVEHAACAGSVQFYAQDKRGRLVALGNQQRVFTGNQRRAIPARDGGCVIPGCDTPPAWCEIHHVKPHALGGETHTDNGVALCPFHHRHIEHHGWKVRMRGGYPQIRAPEWRDPTGTWHPSRPLADTG